MKINTEDRTITSVVAIIVGQCWILILTKILTRSAMAKNKVKYKYSDLKISSVLEVNAPRTLGT